MRVSLGVTTTVKRAPTDEHDALTFAAEAGKTLLLELNVTGSEQPGPLDSGDRLIVIPPGSGISGGLSSSLHSGYSEDSYWMNVLPETGSYEIVVYRRSKERYSLRITVMDPTDPRLDPGISPGRVSVDLSLLAPGKRLSIAPFEPPVFGEIGLNYPASLGVSSSGFWLHIMSKEGLTKTQWGDPDWLRSLARLEGALKPGAKLVPPGLLPHVGDAALMFWGAQKPIEDQSWRGLRWIGGYAQDIGPPFNPMLYELEAISRDGRYYIVMGAHVDYLPLATEWPTWSAVQQKQFDDQPKLFEAYQRRVTLGLTRAAPSSFKPDLRQLDGAVRSLEIR